MKVLCVLLMFVISFNVNAKDNKGNLNVNFSEAKEVLVQMDVAVPEFNSYNLSWDPITLFDPLGRPDLIVYVKSGNSKITSSRQESKDSDKSCKNSLSCTVLVKVYSDQFTIVIANSKVVKLEKMIEMKCKLSDGECFKDNFSLSNFKVMGYKE